MNIPGFLQHYGLRTNPFSDEDAQTDPVFRDSCIETTKHPAWDKLYGDPALPTTAVVFGEKGSGKTALRLQMIRELSLYNADHQGNGVFVIDYSDMNPFLDQFRNNQTRRRKIGKVLGRLSMDDHLDAILSMGMTQLIDRILVPTACSYPAAVDTASLDLTKLSQDKIHDFLTLTAVYDQGRDNADSLRFDLLARQTKFRTWKKFLRSWRDLTIGALGSIFVLTLFSIEHWFAHYEWLAILLLLCWLPFTIKWIRLFWRVWKIHRALKTIPFDLRKACATLSRFVPNDLAPGDFPKRGSSDNRYELLARFLKILNAFGFHGMIVLIDRVDEPFLINGSPELMKAVVWPLLDNKLLKYEGLGLKFLLPGELYHFMEKESKSFHDRARLDKQNVIPSLSWSGEALFDLASARLNACRTEKTKCTVMDLLDPGIERNHVLNSFEKLRVPRHLFKFLYRLLVEHDKSFSAETPNWKISPACFESVLTLYLKERDSAERNGSGLY